MRKDVLAETSCASAWPSCSSVSRLAPFWQSVYVPSTAGWFGPVTPHGVRVPRPIQGVYGVRPTFLTSGVPAERWVEEPELDVVTML